MKPRKGQALRRSLVLTHLQRSSTNHLGSFQLVALRWGTLHNLPQHQGGLPFPFLICGGGTLLFALVCLAVGIYIFGICHWMAIFVQ